MRENLKIYEKPKECCSVCQRKKLIEQVEEVIDDFMITFICVLSEISL
jgi:hypothetical protein